MTRGGAIALAVAAALALGGCGDGGSEGESGSEGEAEAVGQELGGSVAPLAQCSDWNEATDAEKVATIEDIRSQVNREDAGVTASSLTDEEATVVFDNGCDQPYAQGFRLHVMYARAASVKPLQDIAEGNVEAPAD